MPDPAPEIDPRRIRIGLAIVTIAFVVGLVLLFVVDDPVGRAMMAAVSVVALIRGGLLVRSIRRDQTA
ncbi:MAG: hypothetical protein JF603_01485 [Acidobacteria bacterium]|nr:hypothetical protein [Acidobacteriota bacterium]